MKKLIAVVVAAALAVPFSVSAQCTSGVSGYSTSTFESDYAMSDGDEAPNYGVYVWDEEVGAWLLAEQMYVPSAETEDILPDDVVVGAASFSYAGGGGGDDGGGRYYLQGVEASSQDGFETTQSCYGTVVRFPDVVVRGVRPNTAYTDIGQIIRIVVRTLTTVTRTGGGGVSRQVTGQVRQGDQNLNCENSGDFERALSALNVIGKPYRRGVYLIRFGSGDSQLFSITQPLFSDGGIQPMARCVNG